MRVVVALGGHALLRKGQAMSIDIQRENLRRACGSLAPVASEHELAITHGNGPQVGLLAQQSVAPSDVPPFSLDVLDAETQGMIGYLIELELGNCTGFEGQVAALLTMVEVDPDDPAFADPTKPIGPAYDEATADKLAGDLGWTFKARGDGYQRVVPSPNAKRILELRPIASLLERGYTVICGGGGGIPVVMGSRGLLDGVEAVVDQDCASARLAIDLHAGFLVITTDVDAVYLDWGKPAARAIRRARPDVLMELTDHFEAGSMLPKVMAACHFVTATGGVAAIGDLTDVIDILDQSAGTIISLDAGDLEIDR